MCWLVSGSVSDLRYVLKRSINSSDQGSEGLAVQINLRGFEATVTAYRQSCDSTTTLHLPPINIPCKAAHSVAMDTAAMPTLLSSSQSLLTWQQMI
jgi:hypothetical protein